MADRTLSPVQQKTETLKNALAKSQGSLSAIAAKHITPARIVKIVLGAATRTPLLLECSPNSIIRSVMQAVELGLEPGSALNHAYLVPFRNNKAGGIYECTLIVGYMGMAELCNRSGLVSTITAEVVYEGDQFEYELGLEPKLRHIPMDETIDSNAITHAYCVVSMKDGSKVFRVFTRKALDRIRAMSKGKDSNFWTQHYGEMARKTVIRSTLKLAPKSIEMQKAIALEDAQENGDQILDFDIPEANVTDADFTVDEPPTTTDKVNGKVDKATQGVQEIDPVTGEVKEGLGL